MRYYYKLFSLFQLKSQLIKKNTLFKKWSDFKTQLKERKKISFLYGNITRTQISRLVKQSKRFGRRNQTAFFGLLESRIDVFLSRIFFFDTIYSARFWIRKGRILINGKQINVIDSKLAPGDIVTIAVSYRAQLRDLLLTKWKLRLRSKKRLLLLSPGVLDTLVADLLAKKKVLPNNIINILRDEYLVKQYLRNKRIPSIPLSSNQVVKASALSFKKVFPDYERFYTPSVSRDLKKQNYDSHPKGVLPLLMNYLFAESGHSFRKTFTGLAKNKVKGEFAENSFKAVHTEISFKTFSAIWLYPPQKLVFPSMVDGELVIRSLKKAKNFCFICD